MKKCPYCGAQMSDDSLFCTECGKPFPQSNVCPHCGASMNEGDTFCQNCGKKLNELPSNVTDSTLRKCHFCGAEINDGDAFCGNCGANLQANVCPQCGASVDANAQFCSNCGNYLSADSVEETVSSQSEYVYEEEGENPIRKYLPYFIGTIALVAICCGGWWYWSSNKSKSSALENHIVQTGDTIAADPVMEADTMLIDSVAVDDYYEDMVADTLATDPAAENDNYEAYEDYEDVESERFIEHDEPKVQEDVNKVFDVVEQMPSFPGGSEALMRFLNENVRYPAVAEDNGIQGRVIVEFVVERDGSITDVRVAKSVDPLLDKEAVRVLRSMPKWKPGTQNGKPVRVKYTTPVTFRLQ